jgi:hypothetical protein
MINYQPVTTATKKNCIHQLRIPLTPVQLCFVIRIAHRLVAVQISVQKDRQIRTFRYLVPLQNPLVRFHLGSGGGHDGVKDSVGMRVCDRG